MIDTRGVRLNPDHERHLLGDWTGFLFMDNDNIAWEVGGKVSETPEVWAAYRHNGEEMLETMREVGLLRMALYRQMQADIDDITARRDQMGKTFQQLSDKLDAEDIPGTSSAQGYLSIITRIVNYISNSQQEIGRLKRTYLNVFIAFGIHLAWDKGYKIQEIVDDRDNSFMFYSIEKEGDSQPGTFSKKRTLLRWLRDTKILSDRTNLWMYEIKE